MDHATELVADAIASAVAREIPSVARKIPADPAAEVGRLGARELDPLLRQRLSDVLDPILDSVVVRSRHPC